MTIDASTSPSILWGLPFIGLLASIALLPVAAPRFWHRHAGVVTASWAALATAPLVFAYGFAEAGRLTLRLLATQYLPFALTLFASYVTSGGVALRGGAVGSPVFNVCILAIGAALASVMGATGASLLLIRPLLRANADRKHRAHVVIFFIFLAANIGGALSPLGDPPLFVGYLQGVEFFWPLTHLWPQTGLCAGLVLATFFALDVVLTRREGGVIASADVRFEIEGKANLLLVVFIGAAVAAAGFWRSRFGASDLGVTLAGVRLTLEDLSLDAALLVAGFVSLAMTTPQIHEDNGFEWRPLRETIELFLAIFICVEPIVLMLDLGATGPLADALAAVGRLSGAAQWSFYFWGTGLLSSVLDSAPTYLLFFKASGVDPARLAGADGARLAAVSLGAVFMGALTYIGNAPNAIVLSIAQRSGVAMPGFLGYLVWSLCVLGPIFALIDFLFAR